MNPDSCYNCKRNTKRNMLLLCFTYPFFTGVFTSRDGAFYGRGWIGHIYCSKWQRSVIHDTQFNFTIMSYGANFKSMLRNNCTQPKTPIHLIKLYKHNKRKLNLAWLDQGGGIKEEKEFWRHCKINSTFWIFLVPQYSACLLRRKSRCSMGLTPK